MCPLFPKWTLPTSPLLPSAALQLPGPSTGALYQGAWCPSLPSLEAEARAQEQCQAPEHHPTLGAGLVGSQAAGLLCPPCHGLWLSPASPWKPRGDHLWEEWLELLQAPSSQGCQASRGTGRAGIFSRSFCSCCLLLAVSHCEWQGSTLTKGHQEFNRATTQLLGGAAGD